MVCVIRARIHNHKYLLLGQPKKQNTTQCSSSSRSSEQYHRNNLYLTGSVFLIWSFAAGLSHRSATTTTKLLIKSFNYRRQCFIPVISSSARQNGCKRRSKCYKNAVNKRIENWMQNTHTQPIANCKSGTMQQFQFFCLSLVPHFTSLSFLALCSNRHIFCTQEQHQGQFLFLVSIKNPVRQRSYI